MNIAINAWVLRKKELDGIGTFTKETTSRIIAAHPEVSFYILCDQNFDAPYFDLPNASKHYIFPPFRHPLLYIYYMEVVVSSFLKKHSIDLMIAPDGILSLRSKCPQVACIHDLNFVHNPQDINFRNRLYYNFYFPKFAHKATRIATVSQYSRKDIITTYGTSANKIDVIYSGVKDGLKPLSDGEKVDVRNQFSAGMPYFFFAGSLHPRKNIIRLIKAFDQFKKKTRADINLVLAGDFMWDNPGLKGTVNGLENKNAVLFVGRVSEQSLAKLYASAMAVTFVPTFEGFGLPTIEAFATGTPVICSNVTSIPEVAGGAALLVNPFSIAEIAIAMEEISSDVMLRRSLVKKGFKQMIRFSWNETSRLLWQSCTKVLK